MARKERCRTCGGAGRQVCMTCGGRGGRYKVTHDYDYDGCPLTRERWESCYSCGGQGKRPCWRCGGTGEIAAYDKAADRAAADQDSEEAPPPKSPRDLLDEFRSTKRNVLARLLDCAALGDMRWEVRNEIRAIDIDTPNAYEKLIAIEERLAEHPAYAGPNGISPIRWDINLMAMRAKYR